MSVAELPALSSLTLNPTTYYEFEPQPDQTTVLCFEPGQFVLPELRFQLASTSFLWGYGSS